MLERERVRLAEHLALQSTLINLAHDAILVRDPISRVLSWNQGAEALYGWTEKEALGRVSHRVLRTRFPTSRAAVDAQLEREGHWEGELVHSRRDGSVVTVESRQVLIRDARGDATAILDMNALLLDFCQFIVYPTKGSNDQLFGSYQDVLLFAT